MKVKLTIEYTLGNCKIEEEDIDRRVHQVDIDFIMCSKETSALNLALMRNFKASNWDVKISGEKI